MQSSESLEGGLTSLSAAKIDLHFELLSPYHAACACFRSNIDRALACLLDSFKRWDPVGLVENTASGLAQPQHGVA